MGHQLRGSPGSMGMDVPKQGLGDPCGGSVLLHLPRLLSSADRFSEWVNLTGWSLPPYASPFYAPFAEKLGLAP